MSLGWMLIFCAYFNGKIVIGGTNWPLYYQKHTLGVVENHGAGSLDFCFDYLALL